MTDAEEKEFTKKYVECNTTLKRMRSNLVIDLGKFTVSLLYVLGNKLNRPTKLYGAQYGEIEFSVGVIRFKLQFLPKTPGVTLVCRHLEGMTYIDTQLQLGQLDPCDNLIDKVSLAIQVVKPND
jgi:hypothetical protein